MLIILTGFIAALAHVVTGPDHLAAITPLAIESRRKSWQVGLAWGFGHTTGMLVLGLLFILLKDLLPLESISRHSDKIIGFLLIAVGTWAIARVFSHHTHGNVPHTHFHTRPYLYAHIHRHRHDHSATHDHEHTVPVSARKNMILALGIGIVHGLAGFSHLIAILPTLALPSVISSVLYISSFAAGTILTMVVFALIMGFLAQRTFVHGQEGIFRWLTFAGGLLAVVVGFFWIML